MLVVPHLRLYFFVVEICEVCSVKAEAKEAILMYLYR